MPTSAFAMMARVHCFSGVGSVVVMSRGVSFVVGMGSAVIFAVVGWLIGSSLLVAGFGSGSGFGFRWLANGFSAGGSTPSLRSVAKLLRTVFSDLPTRPLMIRAYSAGSNATPSFWSLTVSSRILASVSGDCFAFSLSDGLNGLPVGTYSR